MRSGEHGDEATDCRKEPESPRAGSARHSRHPPDGSESGPQVPAIVSELSPDTGLRGPTHRAVNRRCTCRGLPRTRPTAGNESILGLGTAHDSYQASGSGRAEPASD